MSGWINNLMQYNKDRTTGRCPFCGRAQVAVEETFLEENPRALSVKHVEKESILTALLPKKKNEQVPLVSRLVVHF